MNTANLEKQFGRLGARVSVLPRQSGFTVDIRRDALGSRFEVALDRTTERVMALDVQPRQRHLLLIIQRSGTHKYLCGHDERDWFAAAVPEASGSVSNVRDAMESLKPREVLAAQLAKGVKRQHRNRRRNAGFVRQGEWFFVPAPGLVVPSLLVLHNEPLQRGRGKPHLAEFIYRTGGQPRYFSNEFPRGLSESRYRRLLIEVPVQASRAWRVLRVNPEAYVRGTVRHPDHKTIRLDDWHRVFTNTENQAASMMHLVFVD